MRVLEAGVRVFQPWEEPHVPGKGWGVLPLLGALLLLWGLRAEAATCVFAWDAVETRTDGMPVVVEGYRLYTRTEAGEYAAPAVWAGATTQATVLCSPGSFWVVTAYLGTEESAQSVAVQVPLPLATPPQFRVLELTITFGR